MTVWLHIVGIGEDGIEGLSPASRAVVEAAEIIVGGSRHQNLINSQAERINWPSPFDALIELLKSKSGHRVVVLATGGHSHAHASPNSRQNLLRKQLRSWRCKPCYSSGRGVSRQGNQCF